MWKNDENLLHNLQKQPRETFPKSFKNNKKGVRLFKKFLVVRQHSSQILAFSQSFSKCFSKFFLKIKAIYKSIITLDFRVFPRIAYNCL